MTVIMLMMMKMKLRKKMRMTRMMVMIGYNIASGHCDENEAAFIFPLTPTLNQQSPKDCPDKKGYVCEELNKFEGCPKVGIIILLLVLFLK